MLVCLYVRFNVSETVRGSNLVAMDFRFLAFTPFSSLSF